MTYPPEISNAHEVRFEAGQTLFGQGDACLHYVVVTAGTVKVFARSCEGKELVLYRVRAGEICVLTTSCLLGERVYPAAAIAETPVKAKVIPKQAFDRFLDESKTFRRFVFANLGERLAALVALTEQIALESIEHRLARQLLRSLDANAMVTATHQALALEIGSAREVVSRHLKMLEKQGIVRLRRGRIEVLDRAALSALAEL